MGNKNKTVSFRIDEAKFEDLRSIADERDLSLSSVFREYVDSIVTHDGQVEIVPERGVREEASGDGDAFPLQVEVPKSFVREHERLELECEHLREQLDEYKRYASHLQAQVDEQASLESDMVRLEELDRETDASLLVE